MSALDEPIWAHESPTVSAQLTDDGPSLILELATGRTAITTSLTPEDAVELFDALGEWLGADVNKKQ